MKKFIPIIILALSCTRSSDTKSNYDLLVDKHWRAYFYSSNGTQDPSVVAQQPTFQFRSDDKMYFNQINPVFRDTLNFIFMNETTLKLTKPLASSTSTVNLKIDRLTENDFDFTVTDNQSSDVDVYKTTKQ